MATKEPDRPNPNPELKMTPSQTKLMEHRKVLQDIINGIGTMSMEYWTDSTATKAQDALDFFIDERSKRPTVEQVMDVVDEWSGEHVMGWDYHVAIDRHEDLRSRLTKLLGYGE